MKQRTKEKKHDSAILYSAAVGENQLFTIEDR